MTVSMTKIMRFETKVNMFGEVFISLSIQQMVTVKGIKHSSIPFNRLKTASRGD